MESRKMFKSKRSEVPKTQVRLTALPHEAAVKRFDLRANLENSNERVQPTNGFPGSVYESFGFLTPKKLGLPNEKYKERFKKKNTVPEDLSASLHIDGHNFSAKVSLLDGHEVSSGSKEFSKRQEKSQSIVKVPYPFPNPEFPSTEVPKDSKIPSLPNISTSKETIPRSKSFGRREASKLATNLNLIDGRRKRHSILGGKKTEKALLETNNEFNKISSIYLDSFAELSLPKITIDEVLKSWDVQPSKPTRRKRSSSNASTKPDPMEFLTQREFDKISQPDFSSCYEDVKGCRYLRLGKEEEEEMYHSRGCPCNSCEHGEALKESPYLNA